jgi:hypothetical protein
MVRQYKSGADEQERNPMNDNCLCLSVLECVAAGSCKRHAMVERVLDRVARALAQRRDRERLQRECDLLNKLVGDNVFSPPG